MIPPSAVLLIFTGLAVFLAFLILGTSYLLRVRGSPFVGQTVYECGEDAFGDAKIQFNFRYYVFALIYVIFAVETIFILPWAVALRGVVAIGKSDPTQSSLPIVSFVEMILFIFVLTIGLGYAWKKGALEWQ